ncbi:MAG: Fic family protein [Gammaproteobacteria bacterium]|nr:Fic family protein [Gammaproteobacteria bacterium]
MRNKTDIKPAKKKAIEDRNETIGLMEPMRVGEGARLRTELTDLAIELAGRAAGLRHRLPGGVLAALADLVRAMNCYYSNLIEGHDTHPINIERALRDDYSDDPQKRNLQLEARAHITVQRWIDEGGLKGRTTTSEGLQETHRRFCALLPEELLRVEYPDTRERIEVIPGEFRQRDVRVGRHIPVSPGAVSRFMMRFETAYRDLGRTDRILAAAAAHHRLAWIHPFIDGNGRVARLMSHAMLSETLDTGGIWSIARGLARNVDDYKGLLAACDLPRRNDLDGRGSLSEEALGEFTRFFLGTCIDQVDFMEGLMQPDRLRTRLLVWAEEEIRASTLPPKSGQVLEAVLYRGELPRGDVAGLLGASERSARRITSALIDHGVLTSTSSRAPLHLAFPAKLALRWMPGLFPEKAR